jgi:hypothetical protein
VGKRTRRERKAHQREQALATGDISALREIVAKTPLAAVPALVRALGETPDDPALAAEIDVLAIDLARRLRQGGEPERALAVAAAAQRRAPAWCMEEALAAFALGRDEIAAAIAAVDPLVEAALGPLLQAVRGEVAPASTAAPKLRALHAAARAVGHVVHGEPEKALAIVRRIPVAQRDPGLVKAISSPTDPNQKARILRARMLAASAPGAIAEIIREVGPEAFDAPDRATAALYHGFSLLRVAPAVASRSFDRAVQLGADPVEALRGKMMATLGVAMTFDELEYEHDPSRVQRDAATAAERLAQALARVPLGAPLAAAAWVMAAERWIDDDEPRHALAAMAKARPLAGGKLLDELAVMEADATAFSSMPEAERLIGALLQRSPGCVAAWELKSALARGQGDFARAEAILVEAAAATKDPELMEATRAIQAKHGTLVPFEGLVPGAASAGALAKELLRVTRPETDAYPLASAHRAALGPQSRLAFDGAALAIAAHFGTFEMAEARLHALVPAWRGAPHDLARLIGVALHLGLGDSLPLLAYEIGEDVPAARAILDALAVAGEGKLVGRVLPSLAASLTRQEITLFKAVAKGKPRAVIRGIPEPAAAVRELDLVLAPEFSIENFLLRVDEVRRTGSPGPVPPPPGSREAVESALEMLGVTPTDVAAMPAAMSKKFSQLLLELVNGEQTPAGLLALVNLLTEAGIAPPQGPAPRPRKKR